MSASHTDDRTPTLFRDDYNDKFSPIAYLTYYWSNDRVQQDWFQFQLDGGYNYLRHEAISGTRLLDLGCGPNLGSMIGAPDHFTHIVMADFSPANLEVIKGWVRGDDVNFSWSHVCQYYVKQFALDPAFESTRLPSLKTYIKDVVQCDVLQSEPLGSSYTGFFDCVFSSYCLETASRDIDTYRRSVLNVSSLLRDGGHFVMRGACGEHCYPVDGQNFHSLALSPGQLTTALTDAGLKVKELKIEGVDDPDAADANKIHGYCVLAKKVGS
ncbi:nicotinamide N-methyltransferase-like isoform X1 [Haliotis rubra]|uniref:nicotinamide N-methyltransferase-like isoform X1 n=1 Tax=Haliotis rubra TaxID=36100 RepID=UPI001EE59F92|nr:nicotinamide N-methyltransferase-like isoform X1 [Haliotis rubra]